MDKRHLHLHWPMGGMNRRYAFQNQAPYTTYDALNVRPDSKGGRERGGSRPGSGRAFSQQLHPSGVRMLNTMTWVSSGSIRSRLVAIANGQLWREEPVGTMEAVGGTFNPSVVIHSAERAQKLYIADHSTDTSLSSTTYQPKVYDPSANTVSNWTATDGTIPYGCKCIATWRDRLILGGGTTTPHGLFASRQGDPTDWDYSEEDSSAAWSLTLAEAGQIGDVITALSPHADNCLIVGCLTSLWILRGDPGFGGQVDNLSQKIGVVDKGAWCVTPDGLFVFLSQDGLYMVPAGCGVIAQPTSISRERLPEELLNVDTSTNTVSMEYDLRDRGVHIFVTPASGTGTHWWFDWETKGFWRVTLPADQQPYVCHARRNYVSDYSLVMLGGKDGYIRRFQSNLNTDDGTEFDSHVYLGPFGDPLLYDDILVNEVNAILGETSGKAYFDVLSGYSPESALSADCSYRGRWEGGRNYSSHPKVRGAAIYLKLSNYDSTPWAWEGGNLITWRMGKTRR